MGKFQAKYKLMAKVIHYNISPRGFEKVLNLAEEKFLYVMMSPSIVNIAYYIWIELVEFKEQSPLRANLLFVAMITTTCAQARVPPRDDKDTKLLVRPITLA